MLTSLQLQNLPHALPHTASLAWFLIQLPVLSQGPLPTTQSTTFGTVLWLMVLSAILTLSSMLQFPTWPLTRLADRNTERTRQALTRNIILTASVTYED